MTSDIHPVHRIIDRLGGPAKVSAGISIPEDRVPVGTVGAWKHRRSIPVGYWPRLIAFAKTSGQAVTNDVLVAAHAADKVPA